MDHLLNSELDIKTALRPVLRISVLILCGGLLSACSMGQMVARSSLSIMDSGVVAMNQETDWELAKAAIPANLKLAEGLIGELPREPNLRLQAAQGFYGYAFGFVEDDNPPRAAALYRRGMEHALVALDVAGLKGGHENLLGPGHEEFAVHRAIDGAGRYEAGRGEGGDQGDDLPMAMRRLVHQALALRRPAMAPDHVGGQPGFIDEHQLGPIHARLGGDVGLAGFGDIGPILLGCVQGFF